jgi:hypothetical protein
MKRFVEGEDRAQSALFPEHLDDYIAEENPLCFSAIQDSLGTDSGLDSPASGHCGPITLGEPFGLARAAWDQHGPEGARSPGQNDLVGHHPNLSSTLT